MGGMARARERNSQRGSQRLLLVVIFLLGVAGTAAAFMVESYGASPRDRVPQLQPGYYTTHCLPGQQGACARTYVPPRFRPNIGAAVSRPAP